MAQQVLENGNPAKRGYGVAVIVLSVVGVILLGTTIFFWNDSRMRSDDVNNSATAVNSNNATNSSASNAAANSTGDTTSNSTANTTTTTTTTAVANYLGNHKYVDAKFKFAITLPSDWDNYFVIDSPDSFADSASIKGQVGLVTFYKSTSNTKWNDVAIGGKSYNYGPAFYVDVYTKDAWDKSPKDIATPHGTLLGEKDGKVFALNAPNDTPQDLIRIYQKVDLSTFTAL